MADMHIKIGDHLIRVHCHSEEFDAFFFKNYQILQVIQQEPDIVIEIEPGFGTAFVDFEVKVSKDPKAIIFRRTDYQISVDEEYKVARILVHNELALKHAMMNLYSSFLGYHRIGLLIHSSCAVENGQAHLFAGQSGAGKSTAARLSYPRPILSDEAALVKIKEDGVWVYNSPFRSEITAKFQNGKPVKLSSIQLLSQAKHNQRTLVAKSDAILQLFDKVFYWPVSQMELSIIFQLLTALVKNVPVYELQFQKNQSFWELIS